ncbi:nucleolus and neural progenitor protein [Clupea harengus]|uniref:Nucleolus and neural progenitor protein n=1 Tax=Clupea harengus TaxID=7950 RepID=A0A6P3WA25_CLUHA|nr:nucleolus and neural progenitor protein [Clupea harengus]
MAEEPWNKINIPFPCAVSVYRIPFAEDTDTVLQCLVAKSEKFLKLFCSDVLQTEIRVLYEVLYVTNNSSRQQKPFRALKQVEQCVHRVKAMKLREAVQDLWEACPKKAQRTVGLECRQCEVPSQALLEWVCVKMLGGACLLTRLLEYCSKAFILSRRHLQTGEFLVLNLMLISMLSRLWVFFRGLLRALPPLYLHALELLQQVSRARPLPYLTCFTLPGSLSGVLGPSGADLLEMEPTGRGRRPVRRASKATLLSRLFGEDGGGEGAKRRVAMGVQKAQRLKEDLGSVVLQRTSHAMSAGAKLDIKSLLMGTRAAKTQMTTLPNQRWSSSEDPAVIGQKRTFAKLLDSASSFSDLAENLQEVMRWCRDRKLVRERRSLAFMCLKCRRMVSMEAEGLSVKGRLRRFQRTVRRVLMSGRWRSPLPCHSLRLWRRRLGCRSSIRTLAQRGRTSEGSRTVRTVPSKHRVLSQQPVDPCSVALPPGSSEDEVRGSDVTSGAAGIRKSTTTVPQKATNTEEDDIDDIFSSIGF